MQRRNLVVGDTGRCRYCGKAIVVRSLFLSGSLVWSHVGQDEFTGHWPAPTVVEPDPGVYISLGPVS